MSQEGKATSPHQETSIDHLRSPHDQLGALASIAARIGIYQDTRRLAREAMQAIADLLPIKTAILLLVEDSTGSLIFHEGYNLPVEEVERYHKLDSWDNSVEGEVATGKEPVLIEDVSLDTKAVHYPEGVMSLGLIPLLSRDHVIGVLSVTTAAPKKLDQSDMEFLLTLGSQLGVYLENARLLEELKSRNRQLIQQNQDLEELLSVISHDLRSPLATIGGYASLLIKKGDKLKLEDRSNYAELIFKKTRETSQRFDDILSLFQTAAGAEQEEAVEIDVKAVIDDACDEARQSVNSKQFTIRIPEDLPRLRGYASHLLIVFTNLLSNAFKFIGNSDDPRVEVVYERITNGGEALHRFTVQDNGPGIPKDYISNIFRPFTRVPMEVEIPGSGVGLASVQRIIRSQGGTVDIESTVGQGTAVSFTLPWEEIE